MSKCRLTRATLSALASVSHDSIENAWSTVRRGLSCSTMEASDGLVNVEIQNRINTGNKILYIVIDKHMSNVTSFFLYSTEFYNADKQKKVRMKLFAFVQFKLLLDALQNGKKSKVVGKEEKLIELEIN